MPEDLAVNPNDPTLGAPSDNPYAASPQPPVVVPRYQQSEADHTGGLIPYKNPQALVAYYLGLFSIFPLLGIFLAIPAFILGVRGLQAVKRNPAVKGSVHAWIGVIGGLSMTFVWGLAWIGILAAMIGSAR